jgi:hypothetical protein
MPDPDRIEEASELRSRLELMSARGEVGKKMVDDGFLLYGHEAVKHCVSKSVVKPVRHDSFTRAAGSAGLGFRTA